MNGFSGQGSPQDLFGGPELEFSGSAFGHDLDCGNSLKSLDSGFQVDCAVEPVLTKHQFDRFLGHAFLSVAQYNNIKMPWETGIFAKIFEDDVSTPQLSVPCPVLPAGNQDDASTVQEMFAASSSSDLNAGIVFPHAISCLSDKDFHNKLADMQRRACDKWLSIWSLICRLVRWGAIWQV